MTPSSAASWQAHLASFLLRHAFKPRLARAKRAEDMRAIMNARVWYRLPADVSVSAGELGGVGGEWVEPRRGGSAKPLLYVHGGGYVGCSARTHRPITGQFARGGFRVFAPNYRLAPEHPFPAGVADLLAAYRALGQAVGKSGALLIAGDSAGAGLAVATMVALREQGERLPAAAVLFSPFIDLGANGGSRQSNSARCAMFYGQTLARLATFYLAGADPIRASPLSADLAGLPPLLILVGADETLLDDSMRLAEQARNAGVRVELSIWPVVPHLWPLLHGVIPEGRKALALAAEFLRSATRA
jgi:acetyl esterase/lipase